MNDTHLKFGKELFNETWYLIDKKDRTAEDDIKMLTNAHASFHHWQQCGNEVNFARGAWQISRVYAILNCGNMALKFGEHSLNLCLKNDIKGLDLAFGYESVARAHKLLGNIDESNENKKFALEVCETIDSKGDKDYTMGEVLSI